MRKPNKERDRTIATAYLDGEPSTVIAARVSVHYATVYHVLKRLGIKTRTSKNWHWQRPLSNENRDICIRRSRAQGMTLAAIGKEHGITRERVRQICAQGVTHAQINHG